MTYMYIVRFHTSDTTIKEMLWNFDAVCFSSLNDTAEYINKYIAQYNEDNTKEFKEKVSHGFCIMRDITVDDLKFEDDDNNRHIAYKNYISINTSELMTCDEDGDCFYSDTQIIIYRLHVL